MENKQPINRTAFLVAVLVVFLVSLIGTVFTGSYRQNHSMPPQPTATKLLPKAERIYFGAFANFGPTENTVTLENITHFQTLVGKDLAWAYFSNNWFNGIIFPQQEVITLKQLGITPYIRLMPRESFSSNPDDHQYSLEKISAGEFDTDLTRWAIAAREADVPLIIEFGTEVNGHWFPWNGTWNGQGETTGFGDPHKPDGPERFIAAYQRIINLFRSVGATNVTWVYHINSISNPPDKDWNGVLSYYPGDDYIDWIGVSVYGAQSDLDTWTTFDEVFAETYNTLTTATEKPIMIAEFAVHEQANTALKAAWLEATLQSFIQNTYPRVKGISYWQSSWVGSDDTHHNLHIDSSPEALAVFKQYIAHPVFESQTSFSE